MKLETALDDLCMRFILNLPDQERDSLERLFFQIEEAHWFYEDYYRKKHSLPYFSLRNFTFKIIMHCNLAHDARVIDEEFRRFLKYKKSVPVFGALVFNRDLKKILLVKGFGTRQAYTFPKGKRCKGEGEIDCAIREVYEEVGYDISSKLLANTFLDMSTPSRESRLFVVLNVPEGTRFATKTRNEIKEIRWVSLKAIEACKDGSLTYVRSYLKDIAQIRQDLEKKLFRFDYKRLSGAFKTHVAVN